ncbi:hypothetical protein D9V41_05130 [Aeromicrobium phragmitis]|uniref:Uncharacterized protein n=1 Tax=Aeromicrobium phragmitis TaxID=2478914 RepID=A0A3L8PR11_9ACTN|nr:hypothetical protein [Aeromicrobium phragmitis]RLV56462.1 hypothetical protein D9V41_05130 [Aeromicrobium phragmitis]
MSERAWRAAWKAALDRLELDVAQAEQILATPGEPGRPLTPWVPGDVAGPIPEDMVERARLLHARQLRAVQDMVEHVTATRQQREYVERLAPRAEGDRPSFYVDHSA